MDPAHLRTEYLLSAISTAYGPPPILITSRQLDAQENQWVFDSFIRSTDGFTNLKSEWKSISINPDLVIYRKVGSKSGKEMVEVDRIKTDQARYDQCRAIYQMYHLEDGYPFDPLYYVFYYDQLVYQKKLTPHGSEFDKIVFESELIVVSQLVHIDRIGVDIDNVREKLKQDQLSSIRFTNSISKQRSTYENLYTAKPFPHCFLITQMDEMIYFTPQDTNDLFYYFNQAQLTEAIPFAAYKGFYKFRQDCIIQQDWKIKDEEKDDEKIVAYINYGGLFQKIIIMPRSIIIQLEFSTESTPVMILDSISRQFEMPRLESVPSNQKSIKATCFVTVPQPISNLKLFLFFIHSHPIFSSLVFAEESRVVMSDKRYLYLSVYTNPFDPKEYVSFSLYNVEADEIPKMECKPVCNDSCKPVNSSTYLLLKIRHCPSTILVPKVISILTSLLESFYQGEQRIRTILSLQDIPIPTMTPYVRPIGKNTKQSVIKGTRTRNQYHYPQKYSISELQTTPQLITSFYHMNMEEEPEGIPPYRIITKEENERGKDQPQGFYFPSKTFPVLDSQRDIEPMFFVCNREPEYKFINTRVLSQGGKKSIIPYCYTTNQLSNREFEKKEEVSTFIKSKGSILDKTTYGNALAWINRWYNLIAPDRTIYRKGVTDLSDPNKSILYLILTVIYHREYEETKKALTPVTKENVSELHSQLVREMIESFPNEIRTECNTMNPEMTDQQLINQFENEYIDPLLFCSFLSRRFDIEFIFFQKRQSNSDFYLSHPPFYHSYQEITSSRGSDRPVRSDRPLVGVCINQGTENRFEEVPICELLISFPYLSSDQVTNNFEIKIPKHEDITLTPIRDFIHSSLHTMYGRREIKLEHNPLSTRLILPGVPLDIVSQSLTLYGMVSDLVVTDGTTLYSVFLMDPIHSLPVPIHPKDMNYGYPKDLIGKQKRTTYHSYKGVLYQGYFFPTEPIAKEMTISQFIRYEKVARYLKEYTCFLFSRFIQEQTTHLIHIKEVENQWRQMGSQGSQGSIDRTEMEIKLNQLREYHGFIGQELSPETIYGYIDLFFSTKVEVDPLRFQSIIDTYRFSRILSEIHLQDDGQHGKDLVIPDDDILKKLYYMLLFEYQFHRTELLTYYLVKNMKNFYMDVVDFTLYPFHQVMTTSSFTAFLSYPNDNLSEGSRVILPRVLPFAVTDDYPLAQRNPYFLYKSFAEIAGVSKWLMQPVSSINEAYFIATEWNEKRYNAFQEWKLVVSTSKQIPIDWFHSIIWTSDDQYEYMVSKDSTPLYLSIIRIHQDVTGLDYTYLQVMLPS